MATKGWSFGALTNALKSAAFIDTGSNGGQIPVIDATSQQLTVNGVATVTSGFVAAGIEQNNASLLSYGARPAWNLASAVKLNWYGASASFGIARTDTNTGLGYAALYSDSAKYIYNAQINKHQFFGELYALNDIVVGRTSGTANGLSVPTTDWFRLSAVSATQFGFAHTNANWSFGNEGGIQLGTPLGGNSTIGALQCKPQWGAWESWTSRNTAIQVNVENQSAATGMKFTTWGVSEIASIQGAYTGGRGVLSISSVSGPVLRIGTADGNEAFQLNNGGLHAQGNIIANGNVYVGNGTCTITPDGNVYGAAWSGDLSNWLRYNVVADCRWANERRANAGGRHQPITGLDGNGDNAVTSDLQILKYAVGWYTLGWV